ncbi:hypothetical protein MASR1M97_12330 [Candidatus Desulfobacillus denitrificans]
MRHRRGAAGEAGAGAARHHRHAQRVAEPEHFDDLLLVGRQRHQQRQLAIGGEAVALVGHEVLLRDEQRVSRQDTAQPGDEARDPGLVELTVFLK